MLLGLVNHLMTEYWLLRIITSGEQPTRSQMIASTLARLGVLTVVAVGAAVVFWPNGIGLLLGLAIFRLDRPGDDRAAAAEGAEARMITALVLTSLLPASLAEHGGEETGAGIRSATTCTREFAGMTFNIDTIFSTLVAGAIVLHPGLHPARAT